MKKKMSPDEYGGAPLLGVNGVVIVSHGSSNARAIAHAVRAAAKTAESGMVAALHKAVADTAHREAGKPEPTKI
jgi:glycerol-3-phosphate acyltransferase PlsX